MIRKYLLPNKKKYFFRILEKKNKIKIFRLQIVQQPDLEETFGFQLLIEFKETFLLMSHSIDLEEFFENVLFLGKGLTLIFYRKSEKNKI